MSLLFEGPQVEFIDLTFNYLDSLDRTKYVFTYPKGTNLAIYSAIYTCVNSNNITLVSKQSIEILLNGNKVRMMITGMTGQFTSGAIVRFLCSIDSAGIDFVDKLGQSGTIYIYDTFKITNSALYTRCINTVVLSENLYLGFLQPYPLVFNGVTFSNGTPTPSIAITSQATGIDLSIIDTTKLVGFFNGNYKGSITTAGKLTSFTNATPGRLEIMYLGILEFSLSSTGPWSTILTVGTILPNTTITGYIRCGQTVTTLMKAMNSVRIITTEAV